MSLILIGRGALVVNPVRIGGFTSQQWLSLWFACHGPTGNGGFVRLEWPDGESVLSQPAIVIEMFSMISSEVAADLKRQETLNKNGAHAG